MPFNLVKTTAFFANAMSALIAPSSPPASLLAAAKAGLGTGSLSIGPAVTLADLVEATFVGYAQSTTIVWGAPLNELDGSESCQSPSHLFRATASTTPNTITNTFLTDGVASPSTGILAAGTITPAIQIVNSGDGFSAIYSWNIGLTAGNCNVTIIS